MATILDIPRMEYPAFVALPNGTEIRNHNYSQCVAVANQYHQGVLGLPLPSGFNSAHEWWTRRHEKREIHENYIFSQNPAAGALFIARGGIYDALDGHIGNVTEVRAGGFATLEQNTGPLPPQRYLYRHFRVKDRSILGFLIPRNNPAVSASQTPTGQEEDDDMTFRYIARSSGNQTTEFMLVHPSIGHDLEPGSQRTGDGVTVCRGYMVTVDENIGAAWGRTHARAFGNAPLRLPRDQYIAVQREAVRVAMELA